MAFHVRDPETEQLVREYARVNGVGLTSAVKMAVSKELARRNDSIEAKLAELRRISDRIANAPRTGEVADKAFFDELSGDLD